MHSINGFELFCNIFCVKFPVPFLFSLANSSNPFIFHNSRFKSAGEKTKHKYAKNHPSHAKTHSRAIGAKRAEKTGSKEKKAKTKNL